MDKIVFQVSEQDRIFIESECEKTLHTFDTFFKLLLDEYRTRRTPQMLKPYPETPSQTEIAPEEAKKPPVKKNEKNPHKA